MTIALETWRDRAERAEAELRRIHLESVRNDIAERERVQQEEDARLKAERDAAEATALEAQRVNAWFNHRLEEAQKSSETFVEFLMGDMQRHRRDLPEGWPEGITPEAVRAAAVVEEQVEENGNIASTALGQMLLMEGVRQRRVTVPSKEVREQRFKD
jgi:hypothetical protein